MQMKNMKTMLELYLKAVKTFKTLRNCCNDSGEVKCSRKYWKNKINSSKRPI